MDYAEGFGRIKALLARSETAQWELARSVFEVVEAGPRGTITRLAHDLRVSQPYLSNLRSVWAEYGNRYLGNGTDRTFSEYVTLARSSPERRRDLIEGAERNGRKVNSEDRAHHRRLHSTREFLRDGRHALELLEDVEVERIMDRALRQRRRAHERQNLTDRQVPGGEQLAFDFAGELAEVGGQLDAVLAQASGAKFEKGTRRELVEVVAGLEHRLQSLRSVLEPKRRAVEEVPADQSPPEPRRRKVTPPPEAEPDPAPVVVAVPDPPPAKRRRHEDGPHRRKDREAAATVGVARSG
jgi:hypothetical protein